MREIGSAMQCVVVKAIESISFSPSRDRKEHGRRQRDSCTSSYLISRRLDGTASNVEHLFAPLLHLLFTGHVDRYISYPSNHWRYTRVRRKERERGACSSAFVHTAGDLFRRPDVIKIFNLLSHSAERESKTNTD